VTTILPCARFLELVVEKVVFGSALARQRGCLGSGDSLFAQGLQRSAEPAPEHLQDEPNQVDNPSVDLRGMASPRREARWGAVPGVQSQGQVDWIALAAFRLRKIHLNPRKCSSSTLSTSGKI
jgi:hypothetical protein